MELELFNRVFHGKTSEELNKYVAFGMRQWKVILTVHLASQQSEDAPPVSCHPLMTKIEPYDTFEDFLLGNMERAQDDSTKLL